MKLTPGLTFPLVFVVALALCGCAGEQTIPASTEAPETRPEEPESPPNQADPKPGDGSADDTTGKPDHAPIEMSDVKLMIEAILPSRANGWMGTLRPAPSAFAKLPKDTELLIVYLPAVFHDFGSAKHMCWGSSLLINSDETIEYMIKNLPPELRPGSYLRIVSLHYKDGEMLAALAITKVNSGLNGVEFKSAGVSITLGISKVNDKILLRFLASSRG